MQRSTLVLSGMSVGLAMMVRMSVAQEVPAPAATTEQMAAPAAAPAEIAPATEVASPEPAAIAVPVAAPSEEPAAPVTDAPAAVVTTPAMEAPVAVPVAATAEMTAPAASSDTVVVSVDGVNLTQGDLDKKVNGAMKQEGVEKWPADLVETAKKQYEEQVKELFVTRTVLSNEAKLQNITTTDAEVDGIVESLKGRMKPGRTLEEMIVTHGITMVELRKELAEDHNIEKLIDQQVLSKTAPTEAEIKAYYDANAAQFAKDDQVRASHILVKCEPTDAPDVKKEKLAKIQALRAQLLEGADFAEVAKKNSDCPSAAEGGDLNEFGRGMMVPAFETAAFSQEKGAIGEVVETQFGYHIIKVTEKADGKPVVFEDVKDEVRQRMQAGSGDLAVRDYIDGLRAKAKITGITPVEPDTTATESAAPVMMPQ